MKKALVIYANGSEDLEVTAIADVLCPGGQVDTKAALTASGVEVKLSHGTTVLCDKNLHDCKDCCDVIAIPGGLPGATNCRDSEYTAMLTELKVIGRLIAAIFSRSPGRASSSRSYQHWTCYWLSRLW